jgi:hypothetical protein
MWDNNKRGDRGLGAAISWFTRNGYTVSIPLSDSQDYDLVVDKGIPQRVQIKTTTYKRFGKSYTLQLCTKGGNRSGTGKIKFIDPTRVDKLFVHTPEGDYLFPIRQVHQKTVMYLTDKVVEYKL